MDTGEQSIIKVHPHWLGYVRYYVLSVLFVLGGCVAISFDYLAQGAGVIAFGILVFILGEVFRKAITYYVLDSGVARGYHFLSTSRKFAEYGNIQNIEVYQSFVEKIFGIGSISFDTSGSNNIEVHFEGIRNPYGVEQIVRQKMALK